MRNSIWRYAPLALALSFTSFVLPTGLALSSDTPQAVGSGLVLPRMDSELGRELFATKGCAVCHSINGIGGEDAPPLDAEFMDNPMNPFEFAARMWRGAEAMVYMQREELGEVIELNGNELAAIIAFVHDAEEQAKYSEEDWPDEIADLISGAHAEAEGPDAHPAD